MQLLRTDLQSGQVQRQIADASWSEKIKVLIAIYRQRISDVNDGANVAAAVQQVVNAAAELVSKTENYLAHAADYLANCNNFYLGSGQNGEVVLDICRQNGRQCLSADDPSVWHVTACCAVNPVLQGRQIPATTGTTDAPPNRRLTRQSLVEAAHICAGASQQAVNASELIGVMLEQGEDIAEDLVSYEDALKQHYNAYFTQDLVCGT